MNEWGVCASDRYDDRMESVERLFDIIYGKLAMMVEEISDLRPTIEEMEEGKGKSDDEVWQGERTALRETTYQVVETALVLLGGPK